MIEEDHMPRMSNGELERLQAAVIQAETIRDTYIREIRKDEESLAGKRTALRQAVDERNRLQGLVDAELALKLVDLSVPDPATKTPIVRPSAGEDDVPPMPLMPQGSARS
jgi:hypothetical protein